MHILFIHLIIEEDSCNLNIFNVSKKNHKNQIKKTENVTKSKQKKILFHFAYAYA